MRRLLSPFNVICLLLLLLAWAAWTQVERPPPQPQAPAFTQSGGGQEVKLTLYFSDAQVQGYDTEQRTVRLTRDGPLATAQAALAALASGPRGGGLRALPPGEAPQVWLRGDHAVVNLPAAYAKLNYGTSGEQMLLCTVVNTLTGAGLARDVSFLVAGKNVDTLLGHLDLQGAYTRDDCKL